MKNMDWTALLPGKKTLLLFPGSVDAVRSVRYFGRTRARVVGSWAHDGGETLHNALCEAKTALGMGADDICHVGLPLAEMTLVDFPLPAAAKDDLDNAVRYALMRHVPFSLEQMTWAHDVRESGDTLDVFVALMNRVTLDGLVERLSRAGLPVASVFPVSPVLIETLPWGGVAALAHGGAKEVLVWSGRRICWQATRADSQSFSQALAMQESYGIGSRTFSCLGSLEGVPSGYEVAQFGLEELDFEARQRFRIGLEAEGSVAALRRARKVLMGAALFLICTLLAFSLRDLVIEKRRLAVLEERVASLRVEAETLAQVRQQSDELEKRMERWGRQLAGNLDVSPMLKELTIIVPREAWLDSLQMQDRRVVVSGKAPSATAILESIENSSFFEDAQFDAPITKLGTLEVFRIAAAVSGQ
jgi:general secretion pathway protein L